jgi:hypothetical protein
MKLLCYFVLILGLILFYQQNPLYAIIIIGVLLAGYLYIKSRKSRSSGGGLFGFMKGNPSQQNPDMDNLITMVMLQQLLNSSNTQNSREHEKNSEEEKIEKTKQEILELFDE